MVYGASCLESFGEDRGPPLPAPALAMASEASAVARDGFRDRGASRGCISADFAAAAVAALDAAWIDLATFSHAAAAVWPSRARPARPSFRPTSFSCVLLTAASSRSN